MNEKPDIEVLFEFNGVRKTPAFDGYRPAHLVNDDYLTTGIHHYYNTKKIFPNSAVKGTITFIMPEAHPACLWIGKKINIQEGNRIIGYATVLRVFNSDLLVKR